MCQKFSLGPYKIQNMQIEIPNEIPQKTSTLCYRPFRLWHHLLFSTGFSKYSLQRIPRYFQIFLFFFLGWLVLILSLTKEQKKNTKFWKFYHVLLTVTSFLSRITQENGNRSSRPRVISPLVMSPETWVMLPEILVMSAEKKIKSPEETNTKQIRISDCK